MNVIKMLIYKIRRYFFTKIVKLTVGSFEEPFYVNGFSRVSKKTKLGKNVSFNGISIKECGDVVIGDNFHSGIGCIIITQNHNYEGELPPYDNTYICKKVKLEDNVWLGNRVIILGGATIGEGAIIQAGAMITKNVPACSIVGGNPAKFFKKRDEEHYYRLKKEGKFH